MNSKTLSISSVSLALGIAMMNFGCATTTYPDAAPEITKQETAQAEAQKNNVDVLSPVYFKDAQKALKKAKDRNEDHKDPAADLAEARKDLDKAVETAKPARVALQPVVEARAKAIEANAEKFDKDNWDKAERKLTKTTDDAGKGDLRDAEHNKGELTTLYKNLEASAIVGASLNKAKNDVIDAEKDDAKKYAPKTLRETKGIIEAKENEIRSNLYDKNLAAEAQATTTAATAKLFAIKADAKRLKNENAAIEIWNNKNAAAVAQADAAAKLKAEQAASASAAASAAEANGALNQKLSAADQQIAAQKALEERYQAAKAKFSSNEADVYKDGNNLLIRLKGLNFKTGKADLSTSANAGLVQKVSEVVTSFGQPTVKVEGHTDATGSKAKNVSLSDERAKAVKQALVKDSGLADTKFSAEGYGDSKPLASNKTTSGRAQNRRVDVIIVPEATQDSH